MVIACILSFILVALSYSAARQAPDPVRWLRYLLGGFLLVIFPCGAVFFSEVNAYLYVLLALTLLVWAVFRVQIRRFLPLAGVAVVAAYGVALLQIMPILNRFAAIREHYPYLPIVDRVPVPGVFSRSPLSAEASERLADFDDCTTQHREGIMRLNALQLVHHQTTQYFLNSPLFGVSRVRHWFPGEASIRLPTRPDQIDQPRVPINSTNVSAFRDMMITNNDDLDYLHFSAKLDFVNPRGWGLFESRDRVAGFQPHAFEKLPEPKPPLELEAVELVGLLLHPDPVVYVSSKLPAMAELLDVPTRALTEFEAAGLEKARKGGDLYAVANPDTIWLFGTLRNGTQCQKCHGGERGDLLGAFSYVLRRGK